MQFVAFWEFKYENAEKYVEMYKKMTEERERGTSKSPKLIFGPYIFDGQYKGLSVYETSDPDELMTLALYYAPVLTFKFMPIIESKKFVDLLERKKEGTPL